MGTTKRLEAEGMTLKIPLVWDKNCGKYVLDYPDYLDGTSLGVCHSHAMGWQENMA